MARPMREPAPVVTAHAAVCRDRIAPQGQGRHVPHELTGLMVLPTKRLAQIARCTVESADNTQLSRVRSAAPWPADAVHRRRIRVMRPQTTPHRRRRRRAHLRGWHAAGPHAPPGPGPERGPLCASVVARTPWRAGHQPSGRGRRQPHPPGSATVATGHVCSGPPGAVGLPRRPQAECRSHGATRGSGRRGHFPAARDVSACGTGSPAGSPPHPWGRLAATGACGAAEPVGLGAGPVVPRRHA